MRELIELGGYGTYVWGSYLVTALIMAVEPLMARHRQKLALQQAAMVADEESEQGN